MKDGARGTDPRSSAKTIAELRDAFCGLDVLPFNVNGLVVSSTNVLGSTGQQLGFGSGWGTVVAVGNFSGVLWYPRGSVETNSTSPLAVELSHGSRLPYDSKRLVPFVVARSNGVGRVTFVFFEGCDDETAKELAKMLFGASTPQPFPNAETLADNKTGSVVTSFLATPNLIYLDASGNWNRMRQPDAYSDQRAVATAADTSTVGVKLSVTVPAATTVRFRFANVHHTAAAGAVNIQLRFTPNGGAATVIETFAVALTAAGFRTPNLPAQAGDVLDFNVTGVVPASTCDLIIGYEQTRYPIS